MTGIPDRSVPDNQWIIYDETFMKDHYMKNTAFYGSDVFVPSNNKKWQVELKGQKILLVLGMLHTIYVVMIIVRCDTPSEWQI